MTAHVYVRVSTAKQKHSSQRQSDACIAYAQRLGHADVKVYCDLAVSGAKPISTRKGLQALVANLKHGDVVIYESRDRLARDVDVARQFDSVCDALNVKQYSIFEDGEAEVEALELIRALRAGGMWLRAIADELNARGVACRGERWHQSSFNFGGAS
jgi:DNA invertase Pin-like site-specific DNA recombinase